MKFDLEFLGLWADGYVELALNLSYEQLVILTALTAVLMLYIAYRWFGSGGFASLLVLIIVLYGVYVADIFTFYEEHTYEKAQHMREIQNTIDKSFND